MSDNTHHPQHDTADSTPSPGADPAREPDLRNETVGGIEVAWEVGNLDERTWQHRTWRPFATLDVAHYRGVGYLALLQVLGIHRPRGAFNSILSPTLEIYKLLGAGFDQSTFTEVFDTALAELRRRYRQGDPAVTPYFDPTSEFFE